MRILFVTPYVPSLIRVRPFNFIKHLSRRHEVTLVSLAQGDQPEADALEQLHKCCEEVYAMRLSKARSLMSCCRRLLTPMPLQAAYTYFPSANDLVSRIAQSRPFDVLHVEHIRGAHLAEGVEHIPRALDSVDCITRLLKLRLAHQRGTFQRVLGYEELLKMRSYEPRIAGAFDSIAVTSRRDKRALEALIRRSTWIGGHGSPSRDGPAHVAVVPNGVDIEYFRPMMVQARSATVAFVGRMSYFANVSAALRFYHEVFPHIRRNRPDARFKIIGSDPPDVLRKLAGDPAVEVTGYLPDIRPHLASAQVAVCPLTVGVGIQNKVLEAMAMGKPVVATSVACKGIPGAMDGQHLIRADEPGRIADTVLGLLNNPAYGRSLGERARRFVEERYSWEAAVRELEDVHLQAADMRRRTIPAAA